MKANLDLEAVFRQLGFNIAKAQVWASFVQHTFEVYWEAADLLLKTENWNEFKIKKGAIGKQKNINKKIVHFPIEDSITSEIGELANQIRSNLPVDHFLRIHEVSFAFEALIHSKTKSGRHSRRVDFKVHSQTGPEAPSIAIEAKPIAKILDVSTRYLGEEGIGCFFSAESPYTKGPLGAMFAYTLNDSNASFKNELLDGIKAFQPVPNSVFQIAFLNGEMIACSSHDRDHGLMPILILHVERIFPTVA